MLLMAACDRNLYVGHDEPLALRDDRDAGELAPPAVPSAPVEPSAPVDAGTPVSTPAAPPMDATPVAPVTASPQVTCSAGSADCDGDPTNACETDLNTDRAHCGACGDACKTPDCRCENGKLRLHCDATHADCDGQLNNGCEADLMTSMANCGACQRACHANGHDVSSAMCVSGRCEVSCEPRISPEADCDGDPDNGCETYLLFDAKNCGECGNACFNCEAGLCMI